MQTSITSSVKPIWNQIQSVHLTLYFKNKDSDFAKQAYEVFKSMEKRHPKRVASVTTCNTKLIEEALLPMLIAQDINSGEIVAQVLNFSEYFPNKQAITPENVDKLMRIKGVIEFPPGGAGKLDNKKDEVEYQLSVGSSFLQNQLNSEEVDSLNEYIKEKERIVEFHLDAATVNYKEVLISSYRGVEDPFETEIADLSFLQSSADPSQVVREAVFKNSEQSDGTIAQN